MTNVVLCEENATEMFLTAWMGLLNLSTGEVSVANAGHKPPVLIRDGRAELVTLKPEPKLVGMEGIIYEQQSIKLMPGDILFLYTDGVTNAMDADEKLYGEDRLLKLLSLGENYPAPSGKNGIAGAICEMVAADIDLFAHGAEQSDDITMLCVRYLGKNNRLFDS
jgi:sigma-B regulation protein RsbU (phosphoserine phosphatase)